MDYLSNREQGKGIHVPSFLEMYAKEEMHTLLHSLLKDLFRKISVKLQLGLLTRKNDECLALIATLFEYFYLKHHSASFSEYFYGIQRHSKLVPSLFWLVWFPYLKSKLDAAYQRHLHVMSFQETSTLPLPVDAAQKYKRLFWRLYPFLTSSARALNFFHHLLFLMGHTEYYHLYDRYHRIVYSRVPPSPEPSFESELGSSSASTRAMSKFKYFILSLFLPLWRSLSNVKYGLPALLYFISYWQRQRESSVAPLGRGLAGGGMSSNLSPPAPSILTPLKSAPLKPGFCHLCGSKRLNAAALPSGYLFCFSCIDAYVGAYGTCPVSGFHYSRSDICKLYDAS